MPSVRQITNDRLQFKIFVFSHFGLKVRALKRWCISNQLSVNVFRLESEIIIVSPTGRSMKLVQMSISNDLLVLCDKERYYHIV